MTDPISYHLERHHSAKEWYYPGLEVRVLPRDISDEERDTLPDEWRNQIFYPVSLPKHGKIPYSLQFASRVGTSGHNYQNGTADFATFEFDLQSADGHTKGLTPEQLQHVQDRLARSPHVEIRRSTGGKGLHCRVKLQTPYPVSTPQEYRSLCRFVLHEISKDTDLNLDKYPVCAVGSILWIYTHEPRPDSFKLLQSSSEPFEVPSDWQPPVQRKYRTGKGDFVEVEDEHLEILEWLESNLYPVQPRTDDEGNTCYGTHTCGLEAIHRLRKLRGTFATVSNGNDPNQPNCYMYPRADGAFQVFRYGTVSEPTWNTRNRDGVSWCWFNQFSKGDFSALCDSYQAKPKAKNCYVVGSFAEADAILIATGERFVAPDDLPDREVTISLNGDTITCEIERHKDEDTPTGWIKKSQRRFAWSVTLSHRIVDRWMATDIYNVIVGFHFSDSGRQNGVTLFYIQHADGTWKPETKENITLALISEGYTKKEINEWCGEQIRNPKKIVTEPFRDEHPQPNVWNRGFKFSCEPQEGEYPHWAMILEHTGKGIDGAVAENEWCQKNGIRTGADYLFCHIAKTVQSPGTRVPGLCLWTPENTAGKNTFTDALALLMEEGAVVAIDNALTNSSGFNAELEGGVIYTIHETDLSKSSKTAYNRLKELVTDPWITIHPKGHTPYRVRNWSRIVQTANGLECFVVGFDDERFVIIRLEKLDPRKVIDWETELKPALLAERAAFLHALLNHKLPNPAPGSRCFLPILGTESKTQAINNNLPKLSRDQEILLDRIVALVEAGKWDRLLTLEEIQALFQPTDAAIVPSSGRAWTHAWNRLELHLRQFGLQPVSRAYEQRKHAAAWGFDA